MFEIRNEDDGKKGRFAIYEENKFAGEMTFTWAGENMFIISHTEVDPAFGGKGIGRKLFLKVVEYAREKGVKILPLCPFAKAEFSKIEEARDVLLD